MPSILSAPHFHSEEAAYAYVEARLWPEGPNCPHCGSVERIGKMGGSSTRIGVYKCYACRKPFTVKIGTIFEASHVKLHVWLQAIHLLASSKKGISTNQLKRTLGVSMQTAWFLSHRIREAMIGQTMGDDSGPLGGENKVVEADETYVGGKAKNRKNKVPAKQAVFALVEREGRVRSHHVANVNASTLRPIMESHMDKASFLMTDEAPVYRTIGKKVAKGHGTVNHSAEEYVRLGGFMHTNTAENFFSILKRGIIGTYHHVSEQHLHRYLAEFDFRHNNRSGLGVEDVARADKLLKGTKGKRLTYRTAH
jgi:transposase-like protein